ncbi:MAG TPA: pirin family protein [Acidimicrobiales bacterium]|nr:pirin family protein [Acidimicrobiales bacterium]
MPAVTVDDPLVLPAISPVDLSVARERAVRQLTNAPSGLEGEGFPVRRAFFGVSDADLDPFIHMDQMGEVEYAPGEPKGTPWHPHRGFETVTYMIDGTFQHRDSTGGGGLISDGDTQWMTAGAGILHIERPPSELVASGGLFHGIQLWVNLPARSKWLSPKYQDITRNRLVLVRSSDGGSVVRVIAGELDGHQGPGSTHTRITLAHASIVPGAQLDVPWPSHHNCLIYVLGGAGTVGSQRHEIKAGQLVVMGEGDYFSVRAEIDPGSPATQLDVLLLGGEPIGEPVAKYGPFVMNSTEELQQAFDDFRAGKMGSIPKGEH